MDLEVNGDDVEVLMDDHTAELTTEKLHDINLEVQHSADKEVASYEEEQIRKNMTSSNIKDRFSIWHKIQGFFVGKTSKQNCRSLSLQLV